MQHNRPDQSPKTHQRNADKTARIPIKIEPTTTPLRKPEWIRMKQPGGMKVRELQAKLRQSKLNTVCEEAACPNLGECFTHGTATFMILGDICTRRCPFCDVAHGKPNPVDDNEAEELAKTVADMRLKYVVITSVDRDDLRDGGANHFARCIRAVREASPETLVEILTPDFRGRLDSAIEILNGSPPDVFNHNLETVPRLYKAARPGSDYLHSLNLLKRFKAANPNLPTKSGLMVGLGETDEEIMGVCRDLLAHNVEMLTIGQYLQPSLHHIRLERYVTPETFEKYKRESLAMGFTHVASAPMVRSSYHADLQAKGQL